MTYDRFCLLCEYGTPEEVERALARQPEFIKGDPHKGEEGSEGWTSPLAFASNNTKHGTAIARLLLAAGADVNEPDSDGETPLMDACGGYRESDKGFLELLLSAGADVNAKLPDGWRTGWTALHSACENGNSQAVATLLAAGAEVNVTTEDRENRRECNKLGGDTPLLLASASCSGDAAACVRLLLAAGADVNVIDFRGDTPLMNACARGDQECVDLLLAAGASLDANGADKNSRRLFQYACHGGLYELAKSLSAVLSDPAFDKDDLLYSVCDSARCASIDIHNDAWDKDHKPTQDEVNAALKPYAQIARMLLDAGADVNTSGHGDRKDTPLMAAAQSDSEELVKLLLAAGADVEYRNFYEETPLIDACYEHSLSSVKILLDAGADIEAENCVYTSPLIMAAHEGCDEIIMELLARGARVDHYSSDDGEFPFMPACRHCKLDTVKALLPPGFHTEMRGWWGRTPLHYAAAGDKIETIEFLLSLGANIEARDKRGYTPIMSAIEDYGWDAAVWLADHGANVNASTPEGWTVLMDAVDERCSNVISALVRNGADVNAPYHDGGTPLRHVLAEYGDVEEEDYIAARAMLKADSITHDNEHCRKLREAIEANAYLTDEHREELLKMVADKL